jgi:N-carbamoyl-L-amino-acid hydrolase
VFFTVDLRHPDEEVLNEMQDAWIAATYAVTDELGLEVETSKILDQPPVRFDADCVACVRESARAAGLPAREIVSGAGHDAGYVSRVAPSAMIFVPCRDGISHNEAEFSSKEQCAAGAQVLLQAVLNFDRRLAEKHQR